MSELKTFRAATMREALRRVRLELGPDAVVVESRQVPKRRYPWQRPLMEAEVIASAELLEDAPVSASHRAEESDRRSEALQGQPTVPPAKRAAAERDSLCLSAAFEASGIDLYEAADGADADMGGAPGGEEFREAIQQELATAREETRKNDDFSARLDAIEAMLARLSCQSLDGDASMSPQAFETYTKLIDADVTDTLAREIAGEVQRCDSSAERGRALADALSRRLACGGPIRVSTGQSKTVALVGPTGVGKTTTIAKLAANFRLRDGIRMGLITVDTYRVAAVEQLRTYAEIMDLPMKVVTTTEEMRAARRELQEMELVLIDTAGRSPHDEVKIQELQMMLDEARVEEIHLVLSAVANVRSLTQAAGRFQPIRPTSLLLTKLDEAAGAGAMVSAAHAVGLPLSYITTGQDVPADIEVADPQRGARLILGQASLGHS